MNDQRRDYEVYERTTIVYAKDDESLYEEEEESHCSEEYESSFIDDQEVEELKAHDRDHIRGCLC